MEAVKGNLTEIIIIRVDFSSKTEEKKKNCANSKSETEVKCIDIVVGVLTIILHKYTVHHLHRKCRLANP